jgi:hypothetical protein
MWFMLGALIGTLAGCLAGCLICIRYLRREIAADIGPRLRRIELQLDSLEAALNLATLTRYADLAESLAQRSAMPSGLTALPHPRPPR